MGTHLRWIIALLAALAMGQASAQYQGNTAYSRYQFRPMVRCESVGASRTFCRADTGERVRVARQLSRRPCIAGRTWGYNDRGIWVTRGCRADFAIVGRHRDHDRYGDNSGSSTYVDSSGRLVHCVSTDSGRTYCGTRHSRYEMSGNPNPYCVQNQTWGFDERGVWVSGRCNADFNYYDSDNNSGSGSSTYVDSSGRLVHCVSTDSGRTYCGTRHSRYEMSGNPNPYCVQNQTWGFDDRGVWVSGRCNADFNYYDTANNDSGHSHYVDSSGQLVHCVATASGRTYCGDSHSQLSMTGTRNPACIEGQTWGRDDRGVWVSGGCNADFSSGQGVYTDSSGQVIRCDATGDGRTYCRNEPNRRFLLSRTREGNCVEGQTWGIDDRGLWVSGGCRGDFDYQH